MHRHKEAGFIILFVVLAQLVIGQGVNFSCAKDTTVFGCSPSCITLKTLIPDLKASTTTYTVNRIGDESNCFSPYIAPNNTAGTPAGLAIDDRYSAIINLGFNFPFFGATYNRVVASINGTISFDVTKAGAFAHFGILFSSFLNGTSGTPQNLPNTLYDRAVIMGPYHDLIPTGILSPDLKVQHQVVGSAPYRKWVISYYKVPLFRNACNALIENTHQIVLSESTGIVEIFIYSKQICTVWNQGRAIVGMQDFSRTNAIMAPGRSATDPPWGTINMNEAWRFTPASGASLLKRVELYDLANNLVSTGTAIAVGNGKMEASFPNVCTGTGTTAFIVKPVYQKIDDPNTEIYGLDTVRINRVPEPVSAAAATTATQCGSPSGSITITPALGTAPFEYSLDNGTTFQSSPVFSNLPQGSYTVTIKSAVGCIISIGATVGLQNNLVVNTINDTTVCSGVDFTATTTTNLSGTTFSWSPVNGLSNATAQSPVITAGSVSRYIVTATNGACIAKDTLNLTVGIVPTVQTIADTVVCPGASFTARTVSNGTSFNWSPSTGVSNSQVQSPVITVGTTSRYIVTAAIGACSSKDTLNLTIGTIPTVQTIADTTVCPGTSFIAQTVSNGTSFAWSPAAGLSSAGARSPEITVGATNRYVVTAFIGTCFSRDTLDLNIASLPLVNAGPDQTIVEGDSVQLLATASVGNYLWTPAAGLNTPTLLQPFAKPGTTAIYSLQVTNAQQCSATDNVQVTVLPYCVKPMDAFTPNGDGMNDVWLLTNGNCTSSVSVSVYNRYGSLVFESKDYKNDWNGKYKGQLLPDGTYYFIATYRLVNGNGAFVKGNVTILR